MRTRLLEGRLPLGSVLGGLSLAATLVLSVPGVQLAQADPARSGTSNASFPPDAKAPAGEAPS